MSAYPETALARRPVGGAGLAALMACALFTTSCPLGQRPQFSSDRSVAASALGERVAALVLTLKQNLETPEEPGQAGEWPAPHGEELTQLARDVVERSALDSSSAEQPSALEPVPIAPLAARREPSLSLVATAKETLVYETPSFQARKLGYLRAGAVVGRNAKPASRAGCSGGFYRIQPAGYVCVGKTASLDLEHPVAVLSRTQPDARAALPYRYGMSRFPPPPFYTKLPSREDQQRVEPEVRRARDAWQNITVEPVPDLLAGGRPAPTLNGHQHSSESLYSGRAIAKSGFAFLSFFEVEGRRFGLSRDLDVMPLDRLIPVEPSQFRGVELGGDFELPVAFVRQRGALLYRGAPRGAGLSIVRPLAFREALALSEKKDRTLGTSYLETRSGEWVRADQVVIVESAKSQHGWATPGRTWIDISILRQSLVAYEGTRPLYATLVSTGAGGLGDPEETHSTVQGQFLIHTKHFTATMSGDEVGDEFELRDVPFVQYFTEGYALHAAYWHDSFGRPRSHGCINLSPLDANWLFHWTDPPVPSGWHGAMSLREGTLINIHP